MSNSDNKPRIAFQGERGAFSEEAAATLFHSGIEAVPRRTFADLYRSFDDNLADYILAPVENSISGTVRASTDLLEKSSLRTVAEVMIPIAQHLIVYPGTLFADIRVVQSHPVALRQCRQFFANNPQIEEREADDTAGSVAEIMRCKERNRAAIAGRRAAEVYRASIIRESIQDHADNFTLFVLLARR